MTDFVIYFTSSGISDFRVQSPEHDCNSFEEEAAVQPLVGEGIGS